MPEPKPDATGKMGYRLLNQTNGAVKSCSRCLRRRPGRCSVCRHGETKMETSRQPVDG